MKIVLLAGSPHAGGTTARLSDEFCAGAEEAGHEVTRFDLSDMEIKLCRSCDACARLGKCVMDDGMSLIQPAILAADAVVFVSPLYYYGITANLKAVIDRFRPFNQKLLGSRKKAVLISACEDGRMWAMNSLNSLFDAMCRYLGWKQCGSVLALGAGTPESLKYSDYLKAARELGRNI